MEAARLMHTARQMIDTSRWWLMRWPRNVASLLVRAGELGDDKACKLFRALRVTAVKFGLELASQPAARHDAEETSDARAALRKRWTGAVDQLGPGYRTTRGAEMPDWVAVAHLASYKVRRLLQKCSVEIPKALMPNRQRTLRSLFSAAGAQDSAAPARPTAPNAALADTAPAPSAGAGDPDRDDEAISESPMNVSAATRTEAVVATPQAPASMTSA